MGLVKLRHLTKHDNYSIFLGESTTNNEQSTGNLTREITFVCLVANKGVHQKRKNHYSFVILVQCLLYSHRVRLTQKEQINNHSVMVLAIVCRTPCPYAMVTHDS